MKRICGLLGVLALSIVTASPAAAHLQDYTDGTSDSIDYSAADGDPDFVGEVQTPVDLVAGSFEETTSAFTFTFETAGPLTPANLCPDGCTNNYTTPGNIGFARIYFYLKKGGKEKAEYIFDRYPLGGDMYSILYGYPSNEEVPSTDWSAAMNESETSVTLTIDRSALKGYKKGKKMYWNATGYWYGTAEGGTCVFIAEAYNQGACLDWLPNALAAKHKLKS